MVENGWGVQKKQLKEVNNWEIGIRVLVILCSEVASILIGISNSLLIPLELDEPSIMNYV